MRYLILKLLDKITPITMKVSILILFLSVVLVAFSITLGFLYYKNFQGLSELSKETVKLTSETIEKSVSDLLLETQRFVKTSVSLINETAEVSPQNHSLRSYMFAAIQNHSHMPYFFIGTKDGNYLEVGNLTVSIQKYFISDPSKPLPKEVAYEWQYFQRPGDSSELIIHYFDKDFKEVTWEKVLDSKYTPSERPWFLLALENGHFSWTDVYKFFDTGDPGITAAIPIYDPMGNFIGVMGGDLSFRFLSKFFSEQKIGKTGGCFIVDMKSGMIIIPEAAMQTSSSISNETALAAYQLFLKNRESDFEFKNNDIPYLVHMEVFPMQAAANWMVVAIVPFNDFFANFQRTQMVAFWIVILVCFLATLTVIYCSKKLSDPIVALAKGVDKIKRLDLESEEKINSRIEEIRLMDSSIYSMRLALRSFIHYVPKEIVKQLLAQNKEIVLGGEKKEVTVFFSDIADFTSITEEISTELLMSLLAEYFDGLSKIILKSQGTIDKYIGDSIMGFWGAPVDMHDHASMCAETILLCSAFVKEFNDRRKKEGKPQFFTRFGINTGTVIVGNIGTPERMNYTLVGDVVNSAARLQGVNKIYYTKILISQQVHEKLGSEFLTRPLDTIEVKGKKQKIIIYELLGKKDGPPSITPSKEDLILSEQFTKAYNAFNAGDISSAKHLFEALQKKFPDDVPVQIYLKRIQN